MGRKNQSEEKRSIILDAFEAVILKEGYANASQRKIAEEAGMNQPMIHHYFSGGDELLEALLERITSRYRDALSQFTDSTPSPSLESILSFLTSDVFQKVSIQNEVMFRLIGQAHHHDTVIELLAGVYREMLAELTQYLVQAKVKDADNIAYMLMCIVVGHDWVKALGFGENRNQLVTNMLLGLAGKSQ